MKYIIYRNASIIFLMVCFIIGLIIMYFSHAYLPKQDGNAIDSILIVLVPFIGGIGMIYFGIWGENKLEEIDNGMKMYIIQEDYTCEVEDSFGDSGIENKACITAVATSREHVVKALAYSIFYNCEEYYDVSVRDYQVHEVDVEVGKICFNNKGDFHGFWLTGEEKERVEAMVRELKEKKGE